MSTFIEEDPQKKNLENLYPPPPQQTPTVILPSQIPPAKIAVCIPTLQTVDVRWALNLPQFFATLPPGSSFFADYRYGVAETREALYHTAIKGQPDCTHILYLDSDVIPDPNVVAQLLVDRKPIVSGIYFNSLLTGVNAWRDEKPVNVQEQMKKNEPLIEVDKVGMGICLMEKTLFTDVLKDEEKPLFFYKIDVIKESLQSEDFYFFDKLKKYGIKPWVDLRARALHIKNSAFIPEGMIVGPPQPPGPPQKK